VAYVACAWTRCGSCDEETITPAAASRFVLFGNKAVALLDKDDLDERPVRLTMVSACCAVPALRAPARAAMPRLLFQMSPSQGRGRITDQIRFACAVRTREPALAGS
jgi:hypothetical protein